MNFLIPVKIIQITARESFMVSSKSSEDSKMSVNSQPIELKRQIPHPANLNLARENNELSTKVQNITAPINA